MQRMAFVTRVRPDKLAEYRALHAHPWASVLQALRQHGITNYSIHHADGLLFGYYEYVGDDYDSDLAAIAQDPETQRWWSLTDPCQEPLASANSGAWTRMENLFYMP